MGDGATRVGGIPELIREKMGLPSRVVAMIFAVFALQELTAFEDNSHELIAEASEDGETHGSGIKRTDWRKTDKLVAQALGFRPHKPLRVAKAHDTLVGTSGKHGMGKQTKTATGGGPGTLVGTSGQYGMEKRTKKAIMGGFSGGGLTAQHSPKKVPAIKKQPKKVHSTSSSKFTRGWPTAHPAPAAHKKVKKPKKAHKKAKSKKLKKMKKLNSERHGKHDASTERKAKIQKKKAKPKKVVPLLKHKARGISHVQKK